MAPNSPNTRCTLGSAPHDLLVLNPAGHVPVLVENQGPAICGAYPIMEYLDETRGYAMGDRRLMPDHPEARAEVPTSCRLVPDQVRQ